MHADDVPLVTYRDPDRGSALTTGRVDVVDEDLDVATKVRLGDAAARRALVPDEGRRPGLERLVVGDAGVPQVQSLAASLIALAEDGYGLAVKDSKDAVFVSIYLCHVYSSPNVDQSPPTATLSLISGANVPERPTQPPRVSGGHLIVAPPLHERRRG